MMSICTKAEQLVRELGAEQALALSDSSLGFDGDVVSLRKEIERVAARERPCWATWRTGNENGTVYDSHFDRYTEAAKRIRGELTEPHDFTLVDNGNEVLFYLDDAMALSDESGNGWFGRVVFDTE